MSEHIAIFVTAGTEDEAVSIAKAVVTEGLVACVNIVKGVRSIYRWKGKVEDETEVLMIMKTVRSRFDEVAVRVKQLHSYRVPEVVAIPIEAGSKDYLDWLSAVTAK